MNRRTLSAALQTGNLAEEALDFVKTGGAKPAQNPTATQPVQSEKTENPRPPSMGTKQRLRLGDEAAVEAQADLVSLTVRVPRMVSPGLLLASVDRKLKRQRPWTQQEIVAEALTLWLQQHGYLT